MNCKPHETTLNMGRGDYFLYLPEVKTYSKNVCDIRLYQLVLSKIVAINLEYTHT